MKELPEVSLLEPFSPVLALEQSASLKQSLDIAGERLKEQLSNRIALSF